MSSSSQALTHALLRWAPTYSTVTSSFHLQTCTSKKLVKSVLFTCGLLCCCGVSNRVTITCIVIGQIRKSTSLCELDTLNRNSSRCFSCSLRLASLASMSNRGGEGRGGGEGKVIFRATQLSSLTVLFLLQRDKLQRLI